MSRIAYFECRENNHDKFYLMTEDPTGTTFVARWGRIGTEGRFCAYSISNWNKELHERLSHGYVDRTQDYTPIPVPPVPREQEAVKEPKTLEEALSFKIPCGRYGGQTMKELLDSANTAAITYFLRPLFTGKPVQAAARILAGQYNL